jgi:hypothetical protein
MHFDVRCDVALDLGIAILLLRGKSVYRSDATATYNVLVAPIRHLLSPLMGRVPTMISPFALNKVAYLIDKY